MTFGDDADCPGQQAHQFERFGDQQDCLTMFGIVVFFLVLLVGVLFAASWFLSSEDEKCSGMLDDETAIPAEEGTFMERFESGRSDEKGDAPRKDCGGQTTGNGAASDSKIRDL